MVFFIASISTFPVAFDVWNVVDQARIITLTN